MFGLCVAPGLVPDAQELASLRPAFLRSILYSLDDLSPLLATGLPIVLTLNNQMREVGDWSGWERAVRLVAQRGGSRILAISCGNEFDVYNSRNPADVPAEFANYLVQKASPILRSAGIKCAPTSMGGPNWESYLTRVVELGRDAIDWVDLHPYGKRPDGWGQPGWGTGDLRPTLARAYQIARTPVMMSEYGVKIGEAGAGGGVPSFLRAAANTLAALGTDICPAAAWFCWRDDIGAPDERGPAAFGLRTVEGDARPAWDAFASLGHYEPPPPPPPPDEEPALAAREAALRDLWGAATATPVKVAYNPESAFARWWRQHPEAGSPVGPEHADDEGTFQAFASAGVMEWLGGDQVGRAKVS
jgi:hypothetical protein